MILRGEKTILVFFFFITTVKNIGIKNNIKTKKLIEILFNKLFQTLNCFAIF